MRANPNDLHPNDATGVQVYIVDELNYWCAKFSCTEDELRRAVAEVGTDVNDVKRLLTGNAKKRARRERNALTRSRRR